MSKSDCLPCRLGKSHTFHDSGDPNLAYAFEGTEPPVQDSTYESICDVSGCSGDHDFEHDVALPEGIRRLLHDGQPEQDPDAHPLDLMQQANDLVYGDRQSSYGHPYDDYFRTAGMWSSFLGITISPAQAALMMVLLKISRERNRPKDDNIVDAHGYLLCYGRIQGREGNDQAA